MAEGEKRWSELFLGRESELKWLREGWEALRETGKPQLRVLVSDTGYGKTTLAQQFYAELSREYDPDNYWPAKIAGRSDNHRVMLECARCHPAPGAKVPWFWYGLRWNEESKNGDSPFNAVYNSKEFTVHEEAVLRRYKENSRKRKFLFKLVGSGVWLIADIGTLGAANMVVNVASRVKDGLGLIKDAGESNREKVNSRDHSTVYNRKLAEEKERIRRTFRTLLCKEEGEAESLPVVLLLDDAQWLDLTSVGYLKELWNMAQEEGLPLFILATHWEAEWIREREAGLDTAALAPAFAKFYLQAEKEAPEQVAVRLLKGLEENRELLRAAFPGLAEEDAVYILERTAGNPRHMGEVIRRLERMREKQSGRKPYFTEGWAFTERGRAYFDGISLKIEDLEKERFGVMEEELQELLGLGSMQGTQYVTDFIIRVAERAGWVADSSGAQELLGKAVIPYAVAVVVTEKMHEFRSVYMFRSAGAKLAELGEEELEAINEAVIATGLEVLGRGGRVEAAAVDGLLNFLYGQGEKAGSRELCLLAVMRALLKIYLGGNWGQYRKWRERWQMVHDFAGRVLREDELFAEDRFWIVSGISYICQEQREWEDALAGYEAAKEWCLKNEQENELGVTYHQLGIAYAAQRKWDEALRNYREALKWKEESGQEQQLGSTYHQLGMLYQMQRKWDEALRNYGEALKWNEETCQEHQFGGTYYQLGRVYEEKREWEEALRSYIVALKWKKKSGQEHELGNTYATLMLMFEKRAEEVGDRVEADGFEEEAGRYGVLALNNFREFDLHLFVPGLQAAYSVARGFRVKEEGARGELWELLGEIRQGIAELNPELGDKIFGEEDFG